MKKLFCVIFVQLLPTFCSAQPTNYSDLLAQQLEQKTNADFSALEQNNAQQGFFARRATAFKKAPITPSRTPKQNPQAGYQQADAQALPQ